jgi:serine/threonine protein kinase/tetratricopeptide (TPR) repeat protein
MSEPMPARSAADRNLLFGILALQMDFINRDALIAAMHAWVLAKEKPLGQILRDHGALGLEEQGLLDALVQKHLQKHGNDPAQSLAAVSSLGSVERDLRNLADPDVGASLMHVTQIGMPSPVDRYATRTPSQSSSPASVSQRFRILRPHAHGGLGEVYVALDEELHREVALKEIQDRYADDPESRTRFEQEAEITGGLEHPGIVPVYGLGHYAEGRPFYAMRFIRGDSLMHAIERFHAADAAPRDEGQRTLELRDLLGRFIDVCQAIEYAHSRGVLHRDLKPGNIILGNFGETLVVDWGLAKPLEKVEMSADTAERPLRPSSTSGSSAKTRAGVVMGTPQYMSPEQALGRLDLLGPASDVYSLGATLYCLLTGKPPFTDADVATVLHHVQTGQFPPPRQVKPTVPPALEAICLKAMALRSTQRYASPRALAQDIERWLADEPVSAWREPWQVKVRRWMGRHRPLVAAAAAALLVATVSLAIGMLLLTRANDELRAANQREHEARELAQHNYQLARQAVDRYHTEVSESVLLNEPGLEPLRKQLLEAAREFYDRFVQERQDDPETRAELGRALFRLAQITGDIGSEAEAIELHEQAQAIFTAGMGDPSDLASSAHQLGRLYRLTDHLGKAESSYQNALTLWEKLEREHPQEERYRAEHARSLLGLANVYQVSRRTAQAQPLDEQALTIRQELCQRHPENLDYRRDQAVSLHSLALVHAELGQKEKAEEDYRECVKLQRELAAAQPQITQYQNDLARSHFNRGNWCAENNERDKAESELHEAADLWQRLTDKHPAVTPFQTNLAEACSSLANVYRAAGQHPKAMETCQQALAIQEKLAAAHANIPSYQGDLARGYFHLGDVSRAANRGPEAEAAYQKAIALQEQLVHDLPKVPQYHGDLARSYNNLGLLRRDNRQREQAEAAFRKAVPLWEELVRTHPGEGEHALGLATSCHNLGNLIRDGAGPETALVWYSKAIGALGTLPPQKQRQTPVWQPLCNSLWRHAEMLTELRRYPEAVQDWDRTLEIAPETRRGWYRLQRSAALARAGEHATAVAAVVPLVPKSAAPGDSTFFELARVYSLASAAAGADARLTLERRRQEADGYAQRGIDLLGEARNAGFFKVPANLEKLRKDPDLEALRSREDFQQLLGKLDPSANGRP